MAGTPPPAHRAGGRNPGRDMDGDGASWGERSYGSGLTESPVGPVRVAGLSLQARGRLGRAGHAPASATSSSWPRPPCSSSPRSGDQVPLPDPRLGMPPLARHLTVRPQPAVNDRLVRLHSQPRPPRVLLARRRHRRRQRLAHRAPMPPIALRELPDRQPLTTPVPANPLEQLHPRPRHRRPPRRPSGRGRSQSRWGQKSRPTEGPPGAGSGDHTHRLTAARVTGYAGPAHLHGSVRSYERDRQPGETDNPRTRGLRPDADTAQGSADGCGKVTSRRVARGPIPVSMRRSCRRRLPGGR
jgi:hypothetical protein